MGSLVELGSRQEGGHKLADLGLRDHPRYPMGLAEASVHTFNSVHPSTGNRVRLSLVDYPVSGMGIAYLLESVAPAAKQLGRLARRGAIEDWTMPDMTEGNAENQDLHTRHMKFPAYARFHESHRSLWRERLSETPHDSLFTSVWETRFVEPQAFACAQQARMRKEFDEWKEAGQPNTKEKKSPAYKIVQPVFDTPTWAPLEQFLLDKLTANGRESDQRMRELRSLLELQPNGIETYNHKFTALTKEKEYANEFFDLYLDHIHEAPVGLQVSSIVDSYYVDSGVVIMNPVTRKTWVGQRSYVEGNSPPSIESDEVALSVTREAAKFKTSTGNAVLHFGEVQSNGEYSVTRSVFTYSDEYRETALYPLIAWEETPEGRKFLDQQTALDLLPEEMRDERLDVRLGSIVIAHGQPQVAETFPKEMAIPGDKTLREGKKPTNAILGAQMPVLVYAPVFEKRLLVGLLTEVGEAA